MSDDLQQPDDRLFPQTYATAGSDAALASKQVSPRVRIDCGNHHGRALDLVRARARRAEFELIRRERPIDPIDWDRHHLAAIDAEIKELEAK